MAPLIVQLVAWIGFWLAGVTELLPAAGTPVGALRFALAVMFGFTALKGGASQPAGRRRGGIRECSGHTGYSLISGRPGQISEVRPSWPGSHREISALGPLRP